MSTNSKQKLKPCDRTDCSLYDSHKIFNCKEATEEVNQDCQAKAFQHYDPVGLVPTKLKLKVTSIIVDWFTTEDGESSMTYKVGKTVCYNGKSSSVVEIEKHLPKGEGDKHYCIIYLENGTVITEYNVNTIYEQPEEQQDNKTFCDDTLCNHYHIENNNNCSKFNLIEACDIRIKQP